MNFDLTREPWIPCSTNDDSIRQFSLLDVLIDAHDIREIIGETPPVTIALHRLLLAIIHRIYRGPKDADAWADMYEAGKFDAEKIRSYFAAHSDRFDLFHEKYPFYQTASARENLQNGAAIQLYFQGKNNATLFEHTSTSTPKNLSPAETARLLVAFQAFDFGGLKADGATQMAPLLQSAVALIREKNLFETLMLNLHRYDGKDEVPFKFDPEKDMPAWERDEETHNAQRMPDGPVDLITWQPRKIAVEVVMNDNGIPLIKDAVVMCGYTFPPTADIYAKETMLAYRASKEGRMFSVGFSENRSLWRNADSLLQTVAGQSSPPKTLSWLNDLVAEGIIKRRKFPVDFLGIAADKAKLLFWDHQRFDLSLEYLNDHSLTANLSKCLGFADEIGKALRESIKALLKDLSKWIEPNSSKVFAEANYWAEMELRFHRLLGGLPDKCHEAMTEWFADTIETARVSLRKTIDSLSGTTAEIRASVEAENMLWTAIYGAIKRNGDAWQTYLPQRFAAKGGGKK
jgi:CRISPR system Cascade subunit CasA